MPSLAHALGRGSPTGPVIVRLHPITNDQCRPQAADDRKDFELDIQHPDAIENADLAPDEIALIHRASLTSFEPPALMVRLATLLPCSASSLAAAPIEQIDREHGILKVRDPSGNMTEVLLGYHAAAAVVAAAGDRTKGPLVVDTYGNALVCDEDAEDYARELLAEAVPATSAFVWTMAKIRDAIFAQLADHGMPLILASAQAGIGPQWPEGTDRGTMLLNQRASAEWWTYRMGLRPPSPFVLTQAVRRSNLVTRSTVIALRPRKSG